MLWERVREGKEQGNSHFSESMGRGQADLAPALPFYRNKQKILVSCSRGCTSRYRHLMNDMRELLPHHRKDVKLDSKDTLPILNEICEMKSCNSALFLEVRKRKDLYLWLSKTPNGPSVKFLVVNGSSSFRGERLVLTELM